MNHQEEVIKRVFQCLKERGSLDVESILYNPDDYNITVEEFNFLFDNIIDFAESIECREVDFDCSFRNCEYHVDYYDNHLVFYIMWGQGTANWIRLIDDDIGNWKYFKYQEYRDSLFA